MRDCGDTIVQQSRKARYTGHNRVKRDTTSHNVARIIYLFIYTDIYIYLYVFMFLYILIFIYLFTFIFIYKHLLLFTKYLFILFLIIY